MKFVLVSPVLPSSHGRGIIIYRLLKELNQSSYCLISSEDSRKIEKTDNYSKLLSGRYYYLPRLFHRTHIVIRGINKLKKRVNIPQFFQIRLYFRVYQIIKILKKCNPDLIISCSGDIFDLPASYIASKKLKIPFYVYIFDYYSYQWTIPKERAFANRYEEIFLRDAAGVIVTNEFMQEEIKKIYGVNTNIVYNCNDSDTYKLNTNPWPLKKDKIKILYTGAIYDAHYDAFQNLTEAINSFNEVNITLDIYSNQSKEWLIKKKICGNVSFHDPIIFSKSLEMQKKADILFLPLAFKTNYPEVIKTSMPGKMGEYLASGRPILVHAPEDSFVCWYFKKNKCGVVVNNEDPLELKKAIKKIIKDKKLREDIIQNALKCAENDFGIGKARKNFFEAINYKE